MDNPRHQSLDCCTKIFRRPSLRSPFMPFAAGRPVSLSTKTCTISPTALTSSTPRSNRAISYVTLLLPNLLTLKASSATAGNAIEPKKSLWEWTTSPYWGDVGGCNPHSSMRYVLTMESYLEMSDDVDYVWVILTRNCRCYYSYGHTYHCQTSNWTVSKT